MIVRVVKFNFQRVYTDDFIRLFESKKDKIRSFKGCHYLEMLQGEREHSNVFFTYSYWESEDALNEYRHSEMFKDTWSTIKPWFAQKPEAISTTKLYDLR